MRIERLAGELRPGVVGGFKGDTHKMRIESVITASPQGLQQFVSKAILTK